ncbi:hypothetical protein [Tritonibacter aquimaris]|nr:hypothetical protein [Tritonibacter aquimaris]
MGSVNFNLNGVHLLLRLNADRLLFVGAIALSLGMASMMIG